MQQDRQSNITSGQFKKFNVEPENSFKSLLGSATSSDGDHEIKFSDNGLPQPSGNKEVQSTTQAKPKQARLVARSPLLMRRPSKSFDATAEADRAPDRPKSDMGFFARREFTQNLSASGGSDRGRRLPQPSPRRRARPFGQPLSPAGRSTRAALTLAPWH